MEDEAFRTGLGVGSCFVAGVWIGVTLAKNRKKILSKVKRFKKVKEVVII